MAFPATRFTITSAMALALAACGQSSSSGSSGSSGGSAGDTSAVTPTPTPESTVIDGYTIGRLMADLYNGHALCYGYNANDSSCTAIERIISRSADQIRITHETYIFVHRTPEDSFGGMLIDGLTRGSSINPDGVDVVDTQTLNIAPEGLCHSKEANIQDANMTQYRWITTFGANGKFVEMDPRDAETKREGKASARSNMIGGNYCSRYVVNDPGTITEDFFIDGLKQARAGDVIHVAASTENLKIRPTDSPTM